MIDEIVARPASVRPDEGSQPRPIAKTICSSRPNQNAGSEMPTIDSRRRQRDRTSGRGAPRTQMPTGIVSASAHDERRADQLERRRQAFERCGSATGRPSLKL